MSLEKPAVSKRLLLILTYPTGAGTTTIRVCSGNASLVVQGQTFVAVQPFVLRKLDRDGSMTPEQAEIDLPNDLSILREFASGRAVQTLSTTLAEVTVDPIGAVTTLHTLHVGEVDTVTLNPSGQPGVIRAHLRDEKTHTSRATTGIVVDPSCAWTFGDPKTCGVVPTTNVGTLTAISRTQVTITGLTTQSNFYWERGSVKFDGVEISILTWVSGDSFLLSQYPPQSWLDTLANVGPLSVTVTAGCNKSRSSCNALHNNGLRFCGIGLATPAFHPLIEND